MNEVHMNKEIPQWSWYNGQFLFAIDEVMDSGDDLITVKQFMDEFKQKHGLTNFPFSLKNQGTVISLLYSLLVVPREIWENKKENGTAFAFTTRSKFTISIGQELCSDVWEFLRLMRNSVGHANFSIDTHNSVYKFWNINPSGNRNFEATISHGDLGEFLSEVGKYYINEVTNRA